MLKQFKFFLLSLITVFSLGLILTANSAQAAVLQLDKIGTSVTTGKTFTSWSYTTSNPALEGKAEPNADVIILVGASPNTVKASATGLWTFSPVGLVNNTAVSISSGGEVIGFKFFTSADAAAGDSSSSATASESADAVAKTLPKTGGLGLTMTILMFGVTAMGLGLIGSSLAKAESSEKIVELDQD